MSRMAPRAPRAGFTLIELLVVISIIAILASLLLAGVMYAMKGSTDSANLSDIRNLDVALQNFKQRFGIYPPGIIKLCSRRNDYMPPPLGNGMGNDPMSLDYYSLTALNRMWPKLGNFGSGNPGDPPAIAWDGGNLGVGVLPAGQFILLYGDQSLVYFLGGVPQFGQLPGLGFSTDPRQPTLLPAVMPSRIGPFFEFNGTRIRPSANVNSAMVPFHSANNPSSLFPSYLDAYSSSNGIGNPILYFSASIRNLKNGYFDPLKVPAGFPGAQLDPSTKYIYITQANLGLTDPFGAVYTQNAIGAPYLPINPFQTGGNGIFPFLTTATLIPAQPGPVTASPFSSTFVCPAPDSYQIVTAGRDQVFGPGGQWQSPAGPSYDLPGNPLTATMPGQFDPVNGNGLDDMTSFASSKLGVTQ